MKMNGVPRKNPEQKIKSSVYNFSKNLPKESNKLKFLKNKINKYFLKRIFKLEKFYLKNILLKY